MVSGVDTVGTTGGVVVAIFFESRNGEDFWGMSATRAKHLEDGGYLRRFASRILRCDVVSVEASSVGSGRATEIAVGEVDGGSSNIYETWISRRGIRVDKFVCVLGPG